MTEKTYCKHCYGAGYQTPIRDYYWDDLEEGDYIEDEYYECPFCRGTGEVEYHSKSEMKRIETLKNVTESRREATGVEGCGLPKSGHNCTCGNS